MYDENITMQVDINSIKKEVQISLDTRWVLVIKSYNTKKA